MSNGECLQIAHQFCMTNILSSFCNIVFISHISARIYAAFCVFHCDEIQNAH